MTPPPRASAGGAGLIYDHAGIRLYHAPQEAVLPLIPSGLVDAVITDPPYGTTQLDWDIPVDWPPFWRRVGRLCKRSAVQVMFSAQPFTTDLIVSNRAHYRYELVWPKPMPTGFLDANRRPLRAHENVQVFAARPGLTTYNPQKTAGHETYKVNRHGQEVSGHYSAGTKRTSGESSERFPTTVLPAFSKGLQANSEHETEKPLDLMLWLVATYTNPGDLVLDPFVGSGRTAEACYRLGRRCIGIEIRAEPLEVAVRRLRQDVMVLV